MPDYKLSHTFKINQNTGPALPENARLYIDDLFNRDPREGAGGRRITVVGPEFGRAANNQYDQHQARFQHGSKELWDEVIGKEGKVDIYTARQFVESFENGIFARNLQIVDQRARKELGGLGFETAVNLFDALSDRPMQGSSLFLDRLNRAMGLDKTYYRERVKSVEQFFKPETSEFIERHWDSAKQQGLISKSEGAFADAMAEAFNHPEMVSRGDFLRRKALLQFISDAYSAYVKEPSVDIQLISGPPELGGYSARDERTGRGVIGININNFAFQKNFQSALNILMHERHHSSQQHLSDLYQDGAIKKGDDLYVAARVATANMKPYGYLRPDYMAGPLAYRDQPIEVEANFSGKLAEFYAHKTYARAPDPVVSVRQNSRENDVAKGYEDLVEDWRYGKPAGGGPVTGPGGGRQGGGMFRMRPPGL